MSARGSGIAGLVCFGLIVVGAAIEPTFNIPATDAPAAEVADYTADNRDSTLVAMFAYSLAFGAFFPFAAGVWSRLRRDDEPLAVTFALASAAMATLILAGFVPVAVSAYREAGPELAQALNDLTFGVLALSAIPTIVALGAYAVIVLRTGALWRWTGWIAAIGAVAHVIIAASFLFDSGFFSLEGQVISAVPGTLFAWILAASIALVRAD